MLRRLLRAGARPDSGDYDRRTPLHIAAGGCAAGLASAALQIAGFAPMPTACWPLGVMATVFTGDTLLVAAEGNLPAVEQLMNAGHADPAVQDRCGRMHIRGLLLWRGPLLFPHTLLHIAWPRTAAAHPLLPTAAAGGATHRWRRRAAWELQLSVPCWSRGNSELAFRASRTSNK